MEEFQLNLPSIALILKKIRTEAIKAGLDPTSILQVELAVEEALVNIWKHGYRETHGPLFLEVISEPGEQFGIILSDRAPPFDPLSIPPTYRRDVPLEDRDLGGMGIPMIKTFFDVVEYQSLPQGNELRLTRNVAPRFS